MAIAGHKSLELFMNAVSNATNFTVSFAALNQAASQLKETLDRHEAQTAELQEITKEREHLKADLALMEPRLRKEIRAELKKKAEK